MSLKDRVMDEFDEEYPADEDIDDLNTDQYGSVAKSSWGIWWLFFGATVIAGSPFMFGITLFMFFLLLPFTLMWGVSGVYDFTRGIMRDSVEDYADKHEPDPAIEQSSNPQIEEADYEVLEP